MNTNWNKFARGGGLEETKPECYTKKRNDGSNYTTCIEGQKKEKPRPFIKMVSFDKPKKKKLVIKEKPPPAPKKKKLVIKVKPVEPIYPVGYSDDVEPFEESGAGAGAGAGVGAEGYKVSPVYLNTMGNGYMVYDTKNKKALNYNDYITAKELKIMETENAFSYMGFDLERYEEWKKIDHLKDAAKKALPIVKKVKAEILKNVKVITGKKVLDRTKKRTQLAFKFSEPSIGLVKIPRTDEFQFKNERTHNGKLFPIGYIASSEENAKTETNLKGLFK